MRRLALLAACALVALGLIGGTAEAAPPSVGPVSATNIQGVSALLVGTVDPEGLSTTYRFEYGSGGPCASNPCASTSITTAGADSSIHPARAGVSGLTPDTTYHYRLVATNASGTTPTGGANTFTTTHGFGFLPGKGGFEAAVIDSGNLPAEVAGTHPYQLNLSLGLNQGGEFEGQPGLPFPDGDLRDLRIGLPPGLLLNPRALDERCALTDFHTPRSSPFEVAPFEESRSGESCPERSQVGTIELSTSAEGDAPRRFGLFSLSPPPGVAAQIGAAPFGAPLVFDVAIHANADDSYNLSLDASNVSQSLDVSGIEMALWGIPWNPSHDGERGNCLKETEPSFPWAKCSIGDPTLDSGDTPLAYLTLPTSCDGPLAFTVSADAWQQPATVSAQALNSDSLGKAITQSGCQGFSFNPTPFGFLTDAKASSPSGFNFRLSQDVVPELTTPDFQLPSQTRRAVVALPQGVSISASLGAGLIGCTPAQYGAETAFSPQGAGCPNGSKIGDFTVRSPLFSELIDGAIYLAQPNDPTAPGAENPFDTLVGIYLVAKAPERGILVRLAGKLIPDPVTGNLTATFEGLPQLPYTDLEVNFRTGQRAALVTPPACGPANTTIDLTPWSGPGAQHSTSASQITSGIGAGPCPHGIPPFSPGVLSGGVNSNVNSYTPYFVHITRGDTEQELTSYSLVLPKGITGKLAGIPFCPDQAIAAARRNRGFAETARPSCPQASQVGHTLSGYGVGQALTYASGRIYLAGPYHGSPLSLVTVNAATVGPFDLGTVVIRSAFDIDKRTAQLRIDSRASDPIPHIIDGIPLHLREVRVYVDRYQFTHNPSSCAPSQLESTLTGSGARFSDPSDDSLAAPTSYFQLLNCRTLQFEPKLGIRLRGGTKRRAYPQLRATFAARGPGDSNLKEIAVVIPHQMFVAQEHISGICGVAQFEAERCPANSVYGKAVAHTQLLDTPLRGNVYLRSAPGRRLPDLVADLHSGAIRIVLEGVIDSSRSGGVLTRFSDLPDQPIERFTMTLFGGKRGLLVNSADICATPPLASVKALGQNNLGATFTTVLRGRCKGGGHNRHNKHDRHRGRAER